MSLHIVNITINTPDPRRLADWWVKALDGEVTNDFGEFIFISTGKLGMGFQKAEHAGPNKIHIDLAADDRSAEVERLRGLGAEFVADHEVPGITWTVLRDPDGNEFCVSQGH